MVLLQNLPKINKTSHSLNCFLTNQQALSDWVIQHAQAQIELEKLEFAAILI